MLCCRWVCGSGCWLCGHLQKDDIGTTMLSEADIVKLQSGVHEVAGAGSTLAMDSAVFHAPASPSHDSFAAASAAAAAAAAEAGSAMDRDSERAEKQRLARERGWQATAGSDSGASSAAMAGFSWQAHAAKRSKLEHNGVPGGFGAESGGGGAGSASAPGLGLGGQSQQKTQRAQPMDTSAGED